MRVRMLAAALLLAGLVPVAALAGSRAMHPELGAKLIGTVEVPKGALKGHGIVNLALNATKGTVCWTFAGVAGIDKPTAAHIHKAPAGKAGPVVVPFGAAYKAKGCSKAAKSLIGAIESNPNGYYVNVHTAKYPGGAIRGQLVAGMVHM
jgi:CHRD domain